MKNLILSVFAVISVVLLANFAKAESAEQTNSNAEQSTTPVSLESSSSLNFKLIENAMPILIVIEQGDNLTRYTERYNLGDYQEIIEFNKGKDGERCIKNPNLILRGCVIAVPAYTKAVVQSQQASNESVLERAIIDAVRAERKDKSHLIIFLVIAGLAVGIALIVFFGLAASSAGKKEMEKAELKQKNEELTSKLWAAEDKVKKMESVLPGNYVELQSRENGKIKAKIIKVRLGKNGELEIYVACPAEEHCLVNASENLKLENALSHVYKQHGTSQDLKPNGWTE